MRCKILHECKGRIRLHAILKRMSLEAADQLEAYLNAQPMIQHAKVYERTCDMVVQYDGSRDEVIRAIAVFRFDRDTMTESTPENSGRALGRYYQERIIRMISVRAFNRIFLPAAVRNVLTVYNSIRFIWKGIKCVLKRKMDVSILDALSIGISIYRGDHAKASSVMFMHSMTNLLPKA